MSNPQMNVVLEPPDAKAIGIRSPFLWAIVAVWFAAIYALADRGAFEVSSDGFPFASAAAAVTPPILFVIAYRAFARLRNWVGSLDLAVVTAAQTWRVVGAVFLLLWALGSLPAVFAFPAGLGDVAVGIAAAFITVQVARRAGGWRARSYGLIAAGLFDFVMAFATAILSAPGRLLAIDGAPTADLLQNLPFVFIPAFAVPGFVILHLIAWLKLRGQHRPNSSRAT